ncbi:MAG: histidine--tRNA ligase [Anaerolineae bacterium CG2_30_58_95]|nr:MAG: histidine--tRNA ligase [Anaerolineae bacterium CG2_30_58_95]
MKNIIQPVKGTRDFYPEQMTIRTWLYDLLRQVSESFGYQEWEAPFLESLELYAAKSSEEIVREQSYVFEDRGGKMITLRPELTPSLARMVAQKQNELVFPLRWWSFGPFWRYERPQKGRTREFFQWNVDLLGPNSPESDAENVAVLATLFKTVGLTPKEALIMVSDRRLLDAQLNAFEVPQESRAAVSAWIDRRDKLSAEAWRANARELGLSDQQLSKVEAMLADKDLWKTSAELPRFFEAIGSLGLSDYVRFDAGVVRGFTYYTGTVFEAWEVGGDIKRAILGGGRYDRLLADVGGDRLPAVGYAMGDVVFTLMLEKYGLLPKELKVNPAEVLVTVFSQELFGESLRLASELRAGGLNVVCYPGPAKLPKQFKYADRMGMRLVTVIGPDEAAAGKVTIKDLKSSAQQTVLRADTARAVRQILESQGT